MAIHCSGGTGKDGGAGHLPRAALKNSDEQVESLWVKIRG